MIHFFHRIQIKYQKHSSNAADDQPDTMLMFKQVSTFLFIDIIHRLCNGFVWRYTFCYNLVFLDFFVLSRNLNFNSLKIKRSSQHMPKPMHKSKNCKSISNNMIDKENRFVSQKITFLVEHEAQLHCEPLLKCNFFFKLFWISFESYLNDISYSHRHIVNVVHSNSLDLPIIIVHFLILWVFLIFYSFHCTSVALPSHHITSHRLTCAAHSYGYPR